MGSYFPKINLRPDLPPGSERSTPHSNRRAFYILLGVGLLVFLALYAHFKGTGKKKPQTGVVVTMGPTKPPSHKKPKKVLPPPSEAQEQKVEAAKAETPPPPPVKTQEIRIPQSQEKMAPREELPVSKIQIPSPNLGQKKEPFPGEKILQIALFPGQNPVKVKKALASEGVEFQENIQGTVVTLWRIMVETSPRTLKQDRQRVEKITGARPWRLKTGGRLYLVAASFKEKEATGELAKELEKKGFKTRIAPVTKEVKLKVLSLSLAEDLWKKLEPQLEKLGAQVLEVRALDHKASLSQPASTTSQGKASHLPLPR